VCAIWYADKEYTSTYEQAWGVAQQLGCEVDDRRTGIRLWEKRELSVFITTFIQDPTPASLLSRGNKDLFPRGRDGKITYLHLTMRLEICGAIPPFHIHLHNVVITYRDSYTFAQSVQRLGYGLLDSQDESRFDSRQWQQNFLFFITFRPALGCSQPPIQSVPGAISPGVRRKGREADHSPPTSVEVKNGGTIPSLPHSSSCA
jgi:hypothetical protein